MKKSVALLIFIFVTVISSLVIYWEGTFPVDKNDKSTKIFVIKQGDRLDTIARNLSVERLIRNRIVFFLVVKILNSDKKIQAGDFRLSPSMDVYEVAKTLQHGTLDVWVTVIEGLRKEEVSQIIAQNFEIPETEFVKLAPEGYLFPDTYLIPNQATAESIIKMMTGNFEKKYAPLRSQARRMNLTDSQVATLASLVEREAKNSADRRIVAGILLKRLAKDWALQLDATVQYALGYQADEKTWWKKAVTPPDLKIDSLYNTYKYPGWPPGPICNPGLVSLEAVVNADTKTPYWFYLSDKKGVMHYSVTLEEQEANIKRYLD